MSRSRPPPLPVLPASTPSSSASPSPPPSHYSSPSLPQTQRSVPSTSSQPSPPAAAAAHHHHVQAASHPPLHGSSPHTPLQQQQQQQSSSSPYHARLASSSSPSASSPGSASASVNHSSAERSTPGYQSQRNSLVYTEGDSLDHSYAFVISAPASNPTSKSPSPSHTPPVHGQQHYGQDATGAGELSAAFAAASLSSLQQQQQQQQPHAYPVLSHPSPAPSSSSSSSSLYPAISPPTRTAPPPVPSHMMRVNPSPPLRPDSPLVSIPPVSLQSLSGSSSSPVEARRSDSLSKDDDDAKTVEFYLKQAIQAQDATAVTSLLEKARRLQVDSGLVSAALSVLGESMKTLSFYLRQSMDTKSKDGLKMALDKLSPLMEQMDKAGLRASHAELFALGDDGRRLLSGLDKEAAQTVHFYLKQGIQLRSRDVIKQSLDKTPSIPAEYLDKDLITASQTLLAELDAQHLIKFYLQMAIKQKDDMALEKALDSAKKLRMGGDIAEVSEGSKLLVELRTRGKGGSARKGWKGSSSSSSSSGLSSGRKANGSKKKSDRFVLFGGPLIDAVRQSDRPIPRICYQCMDFLRQYGLQEPGLFRVAGNRDAIELIRQQYEEGGAEVRLSEIHDVAGVLKLYLRMLPEPLIPYEKYDAFVRIGAKDKTRSAAKNAELREQVSQLSTENYALLCSLVRFLVDVARNSDVNKMTAENLAIVFAPNLIRPAQETANTMLYDMPIAINLIACFILCTDDIFTLPPTSPTVDHHSAANNSSAASSSSSNSSSTGTAFMPQYPSAVPSSFSSSAVQPPMSSSPAFGQSLSSTLPHPVVVTGKKGPQSNTL